VAVKVSLCSIFLLGILVSGCESADKQLQSTSLSLFSKCENTFTVSGSRKIYLFEHRPNSVEFDQLAVFDDWAPLSPFLDCANNRIIVPYGARKDDRNNAGVAIIDIESGDKLEYPAGASGIQGIPLKYDNGLLLSTTLLKQQALSNNPPTFGYLPPGESYEDTKGRGYRVYAPTRFFDLSSAKFTKDFDLDLGYSVIQNNVIYSKQRGAITANDLNSKTTDVLYESNRNSSTSAKQIPQNHLGLFLDAEYFMVLNRYSHNTSDEELQSLEKNAIYKLVDGRMQKLVNYSQDDAVYLLGFDKKLYIFTNSLKIIEYDIETMKITERTMASLSKNNNFSIESVGYTEQNFIVALASQKAETSSKIVLISRDFSDISSATSVDLRLISVTTDLAIDTADSRGIQFPADNNALLD
jgi:hypothetical protein